VVEVTHRDVCEEGFLVNEASPNADAIFLDLPAPWLALPHLTRSQPPPKTGVSEATNGDFKPFVSPLNPSRTVHLCTFSPCIEQVQKTVSVMRQLGWVDINMVELAHKRFEIRRERIGIDNGNQRGLQSTPATVDEALQRLLEVEGNFHKFHSTGEKVPSSKKEKRNPNSREAIMESMKRKVYKEGRLVHRTEPEVRTHTSYLVFACLPMEWSAEDEEKARKQWPVKLRLDDPKEDPKEDEEVLSLSKRQLKKAAKQAQKDNGAEKEVKEPAAGDIEAVVDEDE